jgi:glycine/serine hydroxymethyltransferase
MKEPEMFQIAGWINEAIEKHADDAGLAAIHDEVRALCTAFPVPGIEWASSDVYVPELAFSN